MTFMFYDVIATRDQFVGSSLDLQKFRLVYIHVFGITGHSIYTQPPRSLQIPTISKSN